MNSAAIRPRSAKKIIYIASSVTNAPESFREFIRAFKRDLRAATPTLVLEWHEKDPPPTLDDFFRRDLNNVDMCDVMIAFVGEPSIGVGIEIEKAIVAKKKILCLYEEGRVVSRLLMSAQQPLGIPIKKYRTPEEAVRIASEFITASHDERSTRKTFFT